MVAAALVAIIGVPAYSAAEAPPVKLSRSGICHVPGSSHYERTLHFESFDSLQDCLAAGGRPPKGQPLPSEPDGDALTDDRAIPPDPPREPLVPVEPMPPHSNEDGWWRSLAAPGAAVAVIIAVVLVNWWRRRRNAQRVVEDERLSRERWEGHRLSRFDKADERRLLAMCQGDKDRLDRLIRYEMDRDPHLGREAAIVRALKRWQRDHR